MIRIRRSEPAPEILRTEGAARRDAHVAHVATHGAAGLEFARDVYGATDVKDALVAMQHAKCAFCESKPLSVSSGDVEHYRPKAAYRQSDTHPLVRPGYYWLAYEWLNLLFSCEVCNRRHKKNEFALLDDASRCTSPSGDLSREAPVCIDPSAEDPSEHIGFRESVPFPRSARGAATIESLGLNRARLNEARALHLVSLRAAYFLSLSDHAEREWARELLEKMTADEAEYAAMCRAALAEWRAST